MKKHATHFGANTLYSKDTQRCPRCAGEGRTWGSGGLTGQPPLGRAQDPSLASDLCRHYALPQWRWLSWGHT